MKVEVELPEGTELDGGFKVINRPFVGTYICASLKPIEKTAEQKANELGFNVGDKVWGMYTQYYFGIIIDFAVKNGVLVAISIKGTNSIKNNITNKVAVHCPTKEDFEFINELIHPEYKFKLEHWKYVGVNNPGQSVDNFKCGNPFDLIFTVDEYCKAMGIKPLFVTEDGKHIYNNMKVWWITRDGDLISTNWQKSRNDVYDCNRYFSTEQASKDYIERLNPILFYTEDYADGSFPVKSCSNCDYNSPKSARCTSCFNNNATLDDWQGTLKGEPIKKGDKCWLVRVLDNVSYLAYVAFDEWDIVLEDVKYFSNEYNARKYYNSLQIKQLTNQINTYLNGK